ncbi:hypothetical protein GUR42_14710, partial [Staphylococcus aureus]|nr:hypothetical protein [Staphylococcus aureus]
VRQPAAHPAGPVPDSGKWQSVAVPDSDSPEHCPSQPADSSRWQSWPGPAEAVPECTAAGCRSRYSPSAGK